MQSRLIAALALLMLAVGCGTKTRTSPVNLQPMHLCQPADTNWSKPLPQPDVPPPPDDVGLQDPDSLREVVPLALDGEAELAACEWVTGAGTKDDPYVLRDLLFRGITDQPAIRIDNVTAHLVIENVCIEGQPASDSTPAEAWGIRLNQCANIVVRHCQVSRCAGIHAYGDEQHHIRFERNHIFSCDRSIMSAKGSHVSAIGNYTHDALRYGVFLYNGSDHLIENNYVAWTGREGVGTHAESPRITVRGNVVLHAGWTAINVEGHTHDSLVEDNLVVDTHYGIILVGDRTVCRRNRFFYCSQAGIQAYARPPTHLYNGLRIEDNLIVGTGEAGIDIMIGSSGNLVRGNRIYQSATAIEVTAADTIVEHNEIYRFMGAIKVLEGGDRAVVRGNHLYQGRNAIAWHGIAAPGGSIAGNEVHHTIHGINIKNSTGLQVERNTLRSLGMAIDVSDSADLVISDNLTEQTAYGGISLNRSRTCRVQDNRLINGVVSGIKLNGGSGHRIESNLCRDIQAQFWGGGLVMQDTTNNVIARNRFKRCAIALSFQNEGNRDNRFEANTYEACPQVLAEQRGATDVAKQNALDIAP